ncbi:TonB-dependent receptor [Aquimarina sp. AD10]|uniref:Ferrichrome-iron receptor n=1 Tax=Aquimarina aggregata TaxID=1642818 RepID=A0A162ZZ93_9FLAO|nr:MULTISPECIES: TonB-dependent receptor [Aquimarina]AXT62375.1 TonB-dependent receptor [Aquimarina sp. AD10]KZS40150.1 ferrichrome-iron receptor [Aquimarina aggregata]RKM90429.1 TonB-dependent receptor [Aquimarina sp. AD10]
MNTFKTLSTIFLFLIGYASFAQVQIVGTIVDNQNIPIIGATISLKNTTNAFGKLTDNSGKFEINAPYGSYTIEARYLGFQSYKNTIEISTGTTFDIGTIQLEEGTEQLQSVEVVGRARTDYNSDYSFSSTKVAIKNKELPQAVSTITKELINDRQAFQIADAIKNSSSVTHTGFYNHFNIRGIIQAEDGQLINGMRTRQYYFLQPITSHIERAEVIKGPSSVTFSSVDPGGSVNLVTKKPLKENRNEVSATVGSFGTLRATADFTGPLNESGTLLYRFNTAVQEARSFRDLVQNNQFLITPSITFLPNKSTALNVEMIYSNGVGNLDRGQPLFGAINGQFDLNSTDISTNVGAANDFYSSKEFMVISNFSKEITDNIEFNASYMKQTWEEDLAEHRVAGSAAVDIAGNAIPTLAELRYTERQQFWITDNYTAYINFDLENDSFTNKFLVGYDGSRWERTVGGASNGARRYRRLNGTATSFDPAEAAQFETIDINGVIAPRPNVDHFDLADPNNTARETSGYITSEFAIPANLTTSNGIYIQNQFKIGKFSALLNLRYDWYEDIFDYKGDERSFKNEAFIPRIGLTYEATKTISVYGSYVEGFQPQSNTVTLSPATEDFFWADSPANFDPLESDNIEFGAKGEFLGGKLTVNAAVYQITQKNLLQQDPNDESVLIERGEQRSRGFEWDLTGYVLPNLQISASYAFIDAEIIEDEDPALIGERIGGAPEHSANFWGRYDFTHGALRNIGVGLGTVYRGDRLSWYGDRLELPSYTVFDAAVYYRPSGIDMQIALKLNNLFDETYWNGALNATRLFPGAPRNVLLTTTYKF